MPESEPKPKLIELVAPGGGQGWKAVLKSGKPAVVHEIPIPPAEASAAVPRLQRLFDHRHPALSPVLAWGTDPNGIWVAVEPNEGTPLGSILSRGPLTPPAAAALGAAVLSGVAALHEAGIAMGGFGATAIRVTTNGEVRLAGHPAAAVRGAPSQSDLRADVRSSGMAVCAAFGVDPAGAPAPANIPPGLVVTMRSMASGAMGPSADRAQGALREMAAALLSPDREMAAQSELATRAGGREVPPITPFLPAGTVPPATRERVTSAPAPAPYIAPRRDETPVRAPVSYDAPDRPLQTYPSMPAITFPPTPAVPPPAPPMEPAAGPPAVPTWSDPPAAAVTNPPAPAPVEPPPIQPEPPKPAPLFESPPAPAPAPPPPAPTWTTAPPAPAPSFATSPPVPAVPAAQVEPPRPSSWTPVESPVWKPGETVPAEPLGTGMAVADVAPAAPQRSVTAAPAPYRAPAPAPARRPAVPRPPSRGGGLLAERPPWLVPAAVAVVIVILLGIVGIFVLSHRGSPTVTGGVHTTPSPHATTSPHTTPSATQGSGPKEVPSFGATTAAPVSKVQICTTASPCDIPGSTAETSTACDVSSCKLEVAIYFTAVQKSVNVAYTVKFFDRCTGQTTDLPGPSATTPASGYIVEIPTDHWAVTIPSGVKSGAIVAVTSSPAIAASPPLLIGGNSC
ncbi:MAG TPA: hypothetical protein VGE99_00015 [Candidatus Dormibacteraeota bacterium]